MGAGRQRHLALAGKGHSCIRRRVSADRAHLRLVPRQFQRDHAGGAKPAGVGVSPGIHGTQHPAPLHGIGLHDPAGVTLGSDHSGTSLHQRDPLPILHGATVGGPGPDHRADGRGRDPFSESGSPSALALVETPAGGAADGVQDSPSRPARSRLVRRDETYGRDGPSSSVGLPDTPRAAGPVGSVRKTAERGRCDPGDRGRRVPRASGAAVPPGAVGWRWVAVAAEHRAPGSGRRRHGQSNPLAAGPRRTRAGR